MFMTEYIELIQKPPDIGDIAGLNTEISTGLKTRYKNVKNPAKRPWRIFPEKYGTRDK